MICSPILLNEDHGTLRGRALCRAIHRHDTDNRRTAARVDARPPIDGRATDGFTARADDSAEAKQGRKVIFLLHDGNGISLFRLKCQHEIKMPQSHQAPSQGVRIRLRQESGWPECHYAEAMHLRAELGGRARHPKWTRSCPA